MSSGDYITKADISNGEEFNFEAMFGKSYTPTDSIGTHTLIFNNPENPAADGADLVFNYKGTAYTFSIVTLAYVELITGPQILVQAGATVGIPRLGAKGQ